MQQTILTWLRSGQERWSGGNWRGGARLFAVCLAMMAGRPSFAGSVGYSRTTAAGVPLMVLTVALSDPRVKVTGMVLPNGSSDRFDSMVRRAHPTAALTGTYFCERSLIPIGDLVVDGKLVHRGGARTSLCLTDDNECEFIKPTRNTCMDWSGFDFVCGAGPRLVCANKVWLAPRAEGFRDRSLLGRATRLAVGLTKKNRLIFVATRTRISLGQMASAMKALGCVDAINLDAGSSLGFYNGGNFLAQPHRKLTNLILIYDDRARYERFKARLTPPGAQIAKR